MSGQREEAGGAKNSCCQLPPYLHGAAGWVEANHHRVRAIGAGHSVRLFVDRRASTVNQANQAAAKIQAEFGSWPLAKVHQRHVEAWRDRMVAAVPARQSARVEAIKDRYSKIARDKRGVRARRKLAALEADGAEIAARLARTGPRAANKALAHLRRLFEFAKQRRYCVFNPTDGVHAAQTPHGTDRPIDMNVLTPAEIGAMVAAAPVEHRAALLVLAYAGLRIGELVGLTWGDLELNKRRLRVAQQRESATGNLTELKTPASRRFVELPGVVVTALREHELRTKKESPDFVFPLHVRRFRDGVFFPTLRRAKLRRIRLHDLRHYLPSLTMSDGLRQACRQLWIFRLPRMNAPLVTRHSFSFTGC